MVEVQPNFLVMKITYEEGKIQLKYFVTNEVYQFTGLPKL